MCADGYDEIECTKRFDMGCIETVGRVFLGALLGLCCIHCNDTKIREEVWDKPVNKELRKKAFVFNEEQSKKVHVEAAKELGFDPRDSNTVRSYLENPENRKKLREAFGHLYQPIYCRSSGFSLMILVPNGDFSKAGTIMIWQADNGKAFTVTAEMHDVAIKACATYDPSVDLRAQKNEHVTSKLQTYVTPTGIIKFDLSYQRFDK